MNKKSDILYSEGKTEIVYSQNCLIKRGNLFFLILMLINLFYQLVIQRFFHIPDIYFQYIIILLPSLIYLYIFKEDRKDIINKIKPISFLSVIFIIIVYLLSIPIKSVVINLHDMILGNNISNHIVTSIQSDQKISLIFSLFVSVLTPAFCEELVFRGILLNTYKYKTIFISAIINGLMFGMLHLNFMQFTHVFIAGFISVYLYYLTKSIISPLLYHLINNGVSTLLIYFKSQKTTISNTTQNVGQNTNIPNIELIFVLIFMFVVFSMLLYSVLLMLAKHNKVNIKEDKENKSDEKIFNWSLLLAINIFIAVSIYIRLII